MAQNIGYIYGSGVNDRLIVSGNTTWTSVAGVVVASCSGTLAAMSLAATGSFVAGQRIFIHHTRGTTGNTGGWEINQVKSYVAGTITLVLPLANTYTDSGADQSQVMVMPEYRDVTINSGIALTAAAWDGDTGGIITFFCSGRLTVSSTGSISANSCGFRKASADTNDGGQGEGTGGAGDTNSTSSNGNGGGGGIGGVSNQRGGDGGGGGNAAAGGTGSTSIESKAGGTGGDQTGNAASTLITFGGGGGAGGCRDIGGTKSVQGDGGNGAGIILIFSKEIIITGSISANGANGAAGNGGGGGGGGGSVFLRSQRATLGSSLITATGGSGGTSDAGSGGAGSAGRIRLESLDRTGTTNPAASESIGSSNYWSGAVGIFG